MISFHIPGWYSGLTLDLSPKTKWIFPVDGLTLDSPKTKWVDGRVEPSTFFGRTPRFGSLDPHRLQSLGNDELQEETTWGWSDDRVFFQVF